MAKQIIWKLEERRLDKLTPHPKNPRSLAEHDAKNLQTSIEEDGLIDKPVIDLNDQIIGGHQRISILKKMGEKIVECWVPHRQLTNKEANRINLRLNRVHGEFDFERLANEWTDEELLDGGFTQEEIYFSDPIEIEEKDAEESTREKKKKECPACGNKF